MVENLEDDPRETKPNFVEKFEDVKKLKVEAKPNIDGASVHVEASLYVDSGVLPLHANEVDTARFFPTTLNGKIGMTCLIDSFRHVCLMGMVVLERVCVESKLKV